MAYRQVAAQHAVCMCLDVQEGRHAGAVCTHVLLTPPPLTTAACACAALCPPAPPPRPALVQLDTISAGAGVAQPPTRRGCCCRLGPVGSTSPDTPWHKTHGPPEEDKSTSRRQGWSRATLPADPHRSRAADTATAAVTAVVEHATPAAAAWAAPQGRRSLDAWAAGQGRRPTLLPPSSQPGRSPGTGKEGRQLQ